MDTKSEESGREDVKVEVSCTCPFCEREIPPECIEIKVKEDSTVYEICYNARDNGMLDDPRITFDTDADQTQDSSLPSCGFEFRKELITPRDPGCPALPQVCGNCKWYSVQN